MNVEEKIWKRIEQAGLEGTTPVTEVHVTTRCFQALYNELQLQFPYVTNERQRKREQRLVGRLPTTITLHSASGPVAIIPCDPVDV